MQVDNHGILKLARWYNECDYKCGIMNVVYSKTCLKRSLKIDKTMVLM